MHACTDAYLLKLLLTADGSLGSTSQYTDIVSRAYEFSSKTLLDLVLHENALLPRLRRSVVHARWDDTMTLKISVRNSNDNCIFCSQYQALFSS